MERYTAAGLWEVPAELITAYLRGGGNSICVCVCVCAEVCVAQTHTQFTFHHTANTIIWDESLEFDEVDVVLGLPPNYVELDAYPNVHSPGGLFACCAWK